MRSPLAPMAWALASILAPLSGCRCQAKLDTTSPLGHCAKAGPGRGQLSFVATVAPPRLSFEPTCDGSLPLEAGPFHFNPATRVLSGRVRLWNRGEMARDDLVAFVDFIEGSGGDKRFGPHLSTLASVVTPHGRRGFFHGRIEPGQGAWARWSFVVPERAGPLIRGAGWVDPAPTRAVRVELEELASGAAEGRTSGGGWRWLHRLDGYSGWGVLASTGRSRRTSRSLHLPRPGRHRLLLIGRGSAHGLRVGLGGKVLGGTSARVVARGTYDLGVVTLQRKSTLFLEPGDGKRGQFDSLALIPVMGAGSASEQHTKSASHPTSKDDPGLQLFRRSVRRILPPRILRSERQGRQMLPRYLRRRLGATPRQRPVTNRASWTQRAQSIRAALLRTLDIPLHRPTSPPRVRHLSTETRGPLLVERLFIEGSPGIWASALLYRPIGAAGRLPAVLHTLGHYGPGKHYRPSLIFDANLAARGFVVLSVDPLGMGERAVNREDHHYLGLLHWLVGRSTTREMVGEVLRFVDYLQSRPDVDPARVGLTGSSGGGTLTIYATAVDTRIAAAAPLAAVTDWPWLFRFIGGDPEMYPHNVVAVADYATLLRLAAPRPVLVGVGRRDDMFPPRPARRVVRRARDAYRALGAPSHLRLFVDRFPHGLKPGRRKATYRFFQEHLGVATQDRPEDLSLALFGVTTGPPPCTRTLVSSARDAARKLPPPLRPGDDPARALAALTRRRGLLERTLARPTGEPSAVLDVRPRGPLAGNPRTMGLLLHPEPGVTLPSLLVRARGPSKGTIIYVADGGRVASCHAVTLAEAGFDVLVVDLLGLGETTPNRRYRYGLGRPGPLFMQDFFGAALLNVLGDSLMAMRVSQIRSVARWLLRTDASPGGSAGAPTRDPPVPTARARLPVALLGQGTECGVLALAAAALEPRVAGVAALGPLSSFRREIDKALFPAPGLLAHGLLKAVDLPQLMALVAPRPLLVLGSRGPDGRRAKDALSPAFSLARSFYRLLGHPHRLTGGDSQGSEHKRLLLWARQVALSGPP